MARILASFASFPMHALLVIGVIGQPGRVEAQSASITSPAAAAAVPLGQGSGRHAQRLLEESVATLEGMESMTAQFRQRVTVMGESLVGSGSYQQATFGADCLFRMDLKIPLGGDQVSTLIQVSDGRFLWTYAVLPDASAKTRTGEPPSEMPMRSEMTRVDLNQVRQAHHPGAVMAFGGLPHMLRQIGRYYEFQAATRTRLQDVATWKLTGRLRSKMVDQQATDDEDSHGGQPVWVELLIGQEDRFPYHIEFCNELADEDDSRESIIVSASRRDTIAMDFFEVQVGAPIDPRVFVFRPRDHRVDDVTEAYLTGSVGSKDNPPEPPVETD